MPVRDRAVGEILAGIYGEIHWRGSLEGKTVIVGGVTMTPEEFAENFRHPAEKLYERLIESIDWNRVFLEATARHIALDHDEHDYYNMICEECLNEALLADATHYDWKRHPLVERMPEDTGPLVWVYDPAHGKQNRGRVRHLRAVDEV